MRFKNRLAPPHPGGKEARAAQPSKSAAPLFASSAFQVPGSSAKIRAFPKVVFESLVQCGRSVSTPDLQ